MEQPREPKFYPNEAILPIGKTKQISGNDSEKAVNRFLNTINVICKPKNENVAIIGK